MGMNFDEFGTAEVDAETCTGCGQCVDICPDEVLSLDEGVPVSGKGLTMGCIACGHCTAICPTGAIRITGRGLKPDDRFELPPAQRRATAEQLEALLCTRRSVRRFTDREVDREMLGRIVAMTATSPMGIPPHEVGVVVFHGREKVRAFAEEACVTFAKQARLFNPLVLGLMRPFIGKAAHALLRDFVRPLYRVLVDKRSRGIDAFTYDAPAAMLFHVTPLGDPADCYIAATYAMLAAESLGLGNCMLGTTAGLTYDKALKAKYGIAKKNKVGLAVVMGYPAVEFQRGVRRRLASAVFA